MAFVHGLVRRHARRAECGGGCLVWVLHEMGPSKGDQKCPKGGWVEYRNGAWYKLSFGKEQGTLMAAKGAKENQKIKK